MLFKIKDIPIGTTVDNFQFLEVMKVNPDMPYENFYSMEELYGEDWRDWYGNGFRGHCVYHISWLDEVK